MTHFAIEAAETRAWAPPSVDELPLGLTGAHVFHVWLGLGRVLEICEVRGLWARLIDGISRIHVRRIPAAMRIRPMRLLAVTFGGFLGAIPRASPHFQSGRARSSRFEATVRTSCSGSQSRAFDAVARSCKGTASASMTAIPPSLRRTSSSRYQQRARSRRRNGLDLVRTVRSSCWFVLQHCLVESSEGDAADLPPVCSRAKPIVTTAPRARRGKHSGVVAALDLGQKRRRAIMRWKNVILRCGDMSTAGNNAETALPSVA